jgi:hypothetical protein
MSDFEYEESFSHESEHSGSGESGSDDEITIPLELSDRKRKAEDDQAEDAQSDVTEPPAGAEAEAEDGTPPAKKQRTDETKAEAGSEPAPKEPKVLEVVELLNHGVVGDTFKFGQGVCSKLSLNGRTRVTLPPMIVGHGKHGTGPALSGGGIIANAQSTSQQFVLPLTATMNTPEFVKDVYPELGAEQQQFVEAVKANPTVELYRRKWNSPSAAKDRDVKTKEATLEFERTYPHCGEAHVLLEEDRIVELVVASGKYDEDTAVDMVRRSGITNNGAPKKNDDKKALAELIEITKEENEKMKDAWIDDRAFQSWIPSDLYSIGNTKFNGTQDVFNMDLKQAAFCRVPAWEKDASIEVTAKMHPEVAKFVKDNKLDSGMKRMNPPMIVTGAGTPLIDPQTGIPLCDLMEPSEDMDPKWLHWEPLCVGDVVEVSGEIGLIQTPKIATVKFMPDLTHIKLLRRPKNVAMTADALGEKSATTSFGADPFNY